MKLQPIAFVFGTIALDWLLTETKKIKSLRFFIPNLDYCHLCVTLDRDLRYGSLWAKLGCSQVIGKRLCINRAEENSTVLKKVHYDIVSIE